MTQTNPIGQTYVPRITIRVTPLQTNPYRTLLPQINAPNSLCLKLSKLQNFSQSPASLYPQKQHYKYSKPFLFTSQQTNSLSLHFSLIFPPTEQVLPSSKWPVPSRQLVSPPEARRQGSNSQQRPLVNQLRRPEVWKSHTGLGQELWHWERSGSTRRARSFWSESSLSRGWWERSLRTSRPTSDSRAAPSRLYKKLPRLTWSGSSRTPICAPFTPRESPSCPRISS